MSKREEKIDRMLREHRLRVEMELVRRFKDVGGVLAASEEGYSVVQAVSPSGYPNKVVLEHLLRSPAYPSQPDELLAQTVITLRERMKQ
jgi:hypothetical protein